VWRERRRQSERERNESAGVRAIDVRVRALRGPIRGGAGGRAHRGWEARRRAWSLRVKGGPEARTRAGRRREKRPARRVRPSSAPNERSAWLRRIETPPGQWRSGNNAFERAGTKVRGRREHAPLSTRWGDSRRTGNWMEECGEKNERHSLHRLYSSLPPSRASPRPAPSYPTSLSPASDRHSPARHPPAKRVQASPCACTPASHQKSQDSRLAAAEQKTLPTMPALFLLYESAHGYALLEAYGLDAIGGTSVDGVQKSVTELDRFGKVRKKGACVRAERECLASRPRSGGGAPRWWAQRPH